MDNRAGPSNFDGLGFESWMLPPTGGRKTVPVTPVGNTRAGSGRPPMAGGPPPPIGEQAFA